MQNYQMPYQPYLYNQQAMFQQPYQDRLAQLQAMQQSMQQPTFVGLNGKIVDNPESIVANDVPMDGSFAIFPRRDLSEVYAKYWTGDGKIATVRFKPITDNQPEITTPDATNLRFDGLEEVLGRLYDKVDKLSSRVDEALKNAKPSAPQRGRKEVTPDE